MKKLLINSLIKIVLILMFASVSVYYIYSYFTNETVKDYKSQTFETEFHEKNGNKIKLLKVRNTQDSIGLSSNPYSFTVKNNLTVPNKIKIKILDDEKEYEKNDKINTRIDHNNIKVAIKIGGELNIYKLKELDEGLSITDELEALSKKDFSIRIWTETTEGIPEGSTPHYYGTINVEELK